MSERTSTKSQTIASEEIATNMDLGQSPVEQKNKLTAEILYSALLENALWRLKNPIDGEEGTNCASITLGSERDFYNIGHRTNQDLCKSREELEEIIRFISTREQSVLKEISLEKEVGAYGARGWLITASLTF